MKFVFITGGVLSSLGKGITTASLGLLLKSRKLRVTLVKVDPYLNSDAGTMNPYQHGEVFVTEDGGETDLDIGHYERFLGENLTKKNNITAGQVYHEIIHKERRGDYLGSTVQVVPHLTNLIKEKFKEIGKDYDLCLIEIGGTVGDIESLPFLEAARQMGLEENCFYVHVSYVPFVKSVGELKTKPTQHSVQKLREIGIQPDAIVCRSEYPLTEEARSKIALFSSVPVRAVISAYDVDNVYRIPFILASQGLDDLILEKLGIRTYLKRDMRDWEEFINKLENPKKTKKVAIVGKYVEVRDAYKSLIEAIIHAGAHTLTKPEIDLMDSMDIEEKGAEEVLKGYDVIIIAGGFGKRGIEGKIEAIRFARENKIPILGICLGMQLMTVEWARNVLGWKDAHSEEFNKDTKHPVIHLLPEQKEKPLGGTMRLGGQEVKLKEGTMIYEIYKTDRIFERHRHRYEFNNEFRKDFEKSGLTISGETNGLVEVIEWSEHPFFIGVQFHPEYSSKPLKPHPIFIRLMEM